MSSPLQHHTEKFHCLKIIYALPIYPSLFLTPVNHLSFHCIYRFIFLECHIVGIIQCVVLSDWLALFSNVHWSFLHAFSWVVKVFHLFVCFCFFNAESYSTPWMCHIMSLSKFDHYDQSCYISHDFFCGHKF